MQLGIPEEAELKDVYRDCAEPKFLKRISPETFCQFVAGRMHAEACCNRETDALDTAYRKYVRDEVQYALERRGWKWNADSGAFDGISHEEYMKTRHDVLVILVFHAIEFFRKNNMEIDPPQGDNRNLRVPLKGLYGFL
jgi:hypothetical protein